MLDRDGRVAQYGSQEGLVHTAIRTIHQDRWGDIWIGGDGGVSRLRGSRFQTLSFRNEVPRWPVAAIMDDDAGDFWIAFAFFGFIRVGHEDISRAMNDSSYPQHYRVYTSGYGAGYPDVSYGGSTGRGTNGSLWFLSSRGVTMIDPRELRTLDTAPIGPRVEGITADDRRYSATSTIALPPPHHPVTYRLRGRQSVIVVGPDPLPVPARRLRHQLGGWHGPTTSLLYETFHPGPITSGCRRRTTR